MTFTTTLQQLRDAGACHERYKYLATALGGISSHGKDTPISVERILEINGINDALWALCTTSAGEKVAQLFACDCAERVLPNDACVRDCITTARRYIHGEATPEELRVTIIAAKEGVRGKESIKWAAASAVHAAESAVPGVESDWAWRMAAEAAAEARWAARGRYDNARVAVAAERAWQVNRLKQLLSEEE